MKQKQFVNENNNNNQSIQNNMISVKQMYYWWKSVLIICTLTSIFLLMTGFTVKHEAQVFTTDQ
jgi:hypothetical protein